MGQLLRIAVVEDEENERNQILQYLGRYLKENQIEAEVVSYTDGMQIADDYEGKYDLIFLDIQMRHMDGLTAARRIRERDEEVVLIFITNLAQYAIKGYSVGAMNFILKPLNYVTFAEECRSAFRHLERNRKKAILINTEDGLARLYYDEIYYIEMRNRKACFCTRRGEYQLRETLTNLEEKLSDRRFFRCHSGFLVNLFYVERVAGNTLFVNGSPIPLSRANKRDFEDRYEEVFGGEI